jgi:hypothetical protein
MAPLGLSPSQISHVVDPAAKTTSDADFPFTRSELATTAAAGTGQTLFQQLVARHSQLVASYSRSVLGSATVNNATDRAVEEHASFAAANATGLAQDGK